MFSLAVPGAGAQAATVTAYHPTLNGGEAAWTTAAGLLGTIVSESFDAAPTNFAITFGSHLPGSISGGEYHDRANDNLAEQATKPLFTFPGPGAWAFGGHWDLAPNVPGTGIKLFLTFTDLTTATVGTEIPKTFNGQFFGIISDMPILSIRLDEGTQGGQYETFDLLDAQLVAVPIPAALPLFLSAIAGLVFVARRRKLSANA